jgi:hypothetical protein
MKIRLRDYVITKDDCIYSVVSYDNRAGIKSVLRYVPDERGKRIRKLGHVPEVNRSKGMRYRKLSSSESGVHVVSKEDVKEILRPDESLMKMKDDRVLRIMRCLHSIPASKMGVTGSFLCGLNDDSSDIDFVVYGREWFRARDEIENAKAQNQNREGISELSDEMWKRVYKKRNPELSFEEFLLHEKRKGNRGMVDGTYFDLLYTRDWDEICNSNIEERKGKVIAHTKIIAPVTSVCFAFDCPAIYEIEHESIDSVLSFSHTYVGQALPGETIEAKGQVEEISEETRLIVGTTIDARGEWIKSLTLLDKFI